MNYRHYTLAGDSCDARHEVSSSASVVQQQQPQQQHTWALHRRIVLPDAQRIISV